MINRRNLLASASAFTLLGASLGRAQAAPAETDWLHYANDLSSTRYSPLDQISATNFNQLDHARIWVPADPIDRPFLLAHPYSSEISGETRAYAAAHGLKVGDFYPGDYRYGFNTIPVKMTLGTHYVRAENWVEDGLYDEPEAMTTRPPNDSEAVVSALLAVADELRELRNLLAIRLQSH